MNGTNQTPQAVTTAYTAPIDSPAETSPNSKSFNGGLNNIISKLINQKSPNRHNDKGISFVIYGMESQYTRQ